MSLLVVGSLALDTIETPTERRENILGGSALHCAFSAAFFSPVRMVSVVGEDWNPADTKMLEGRGIDMSGLEIPAGGKTFRWTGKYLENMNDRETLETQLNVLGNFQPKIPASFRDSKYVLLGNGSTITQHMVIDQIDKPELLVADTMNLWIDIERTELLRLLTRVDGLVLNDSEAKMLTGQINTVTAGRKILDLGPKFVVVKKGEHGAMLFSESETFMIPAYPTETVIDPTGAGDSFAGGMLGYIASTGKCDMKTIRRGIAYGSLIASFQVEAFSMERLQNLTRADIDERFARFQKMCEF